MSALEPLACSHENFGQLAGSGSLPDAALDANGQLVTDQAAVLRVWRGFYERLGRADVIPDVGDRASASRFDDDFARQIVERLRERVLDPRGDLPELSKAIDWAELYAALLASPDGKATGPDHVPYELLRHAGIGAAIALAALFNYFWRHQVWPEQLQRALLAALYKGEDQRTDPNSYRLLSMMSVVSKVFEKVLDNRIRVWGERTGVLSDLQGGFRTNRGTVDQLFILNEIVAHRRENGESTFLTFIDVSKAYDRVWRPGLWFKLGEIGLGNLGFMIQEMYRKVVRAIMVNGQLTEDFKVEAGVPQGAILSPFLYAVYIDGLHNALREAGLGVRIFGRLVPLLMYADDIVVLARDAEEMGRCIVSSSVTPRNGASGLTKVSPK